MPIQTFRRSTLFALIVGLAVAQPVFAADNVALQWNSAALQAIRNSAAPPTRTARAFAILHTCMYDAWAAYDGVAVGTRLGASLRRPLPERTAGNKVTAVSFAAYRALVDQFPTQKTVVFDSLMASLGYNILDTSVDVTTPTGIGNAACAAVLAFRHHDGANQLGDMPGSNGTPYSDYTNYTPVNTATVLNQPDRWQPLGTQTFLHPQWGRVTPFAIASMNDIRPGPPAFFGSNEFDHQAREIVNFSEHLDDRRKAIATYWADGPNTETPPGHWNLFAQFVSRRDAHTLDQDVKMFFVLGNALLDASIAVWECKVHFDYTRPITAIRFLYAGRMIEAWAGPGLGTALIPGSSFRSYIPTPAFGEYSSGHSAFSAASAAVLTWFTGSPRFNGSVTIPAGSSFVEPGIAPAGNVTLSWNTFEEAANEAGQSRRYGGIHFKDGDLASRKIGRQVGALVIGKTSAFFDGTAQTP